MKTTLNQIRKHSPCGIKPNNDGSLSGLLKLMKYLGKDETDDEPVSITQIIDSNGLDDAIWCLRAVEGRDKEIRLFAVFCARKVQHLMINPKSIRAINIAEKFANGNASAEELEVARCAAAAVDDAVVVAAAAVAAASVAVVVAAVAAASAYAAASYAKATFRDEQEKELRRVCDALEGLK